jgi:hypothetical protein
MPVGCIGSRPRRNGSMLVEAGPSIGSIARLTFTWRNRQTSCCNTRRTLTTFLSDPTRWVRTRQTVLDYSTCTETFTSGVRMWFRMAIPLRCASSGVEAGTISSEVAGERPTINSHLPCDKATLDFAWPGFPVAKPNNKYKTTKQNPQSRGRHKRIQVMVVPLDYPHTLFEGYP